MPSFRPAAAVALAALALALAACQPTPAPPAASPSATATTAPSRPPGETPDASPSTTPSAEAPAPRPSSTTGEGGLPADCESAYSPQTVQRLYDAFGRLNPEGASFNTHFMGDLYDLVQPLPTLTCLWSPPGDTALMTDAIRIAPEQADDVRAILSASIPGCTDTDQGFVCDSETEQTEGAVRIEHHVLHGDLLLMTAGLNADPALVDAAVDDMIATIGG